MATNIIHSVDEKIFNFDLNIFYLSSSINNAVVDLAVGPLTFNGRETIECGKAILILKKLS